MRPQSDVLKSRLHAELISWILHEVGLYDVMLVADAEVKAFTKKLAEVESDIAWYRR